LVTGKTPNVERDRLYEEFRQGNIKLLVVTRWQTSQLTAGRQRSDTGIGTFGSRRRRRNGWGASCGPRKTALSPISIRS